MDDIQFSLQIPLDEDGFLEMECDYCKGRFMLTKETFEDEENLNFFCPICGLPNRINAFYCPEVLETAEKIAANCIMDKVYRDLSKSFNSFNKNGLFKLSMDKPKHEQVSELYTPVNQYKKKRLSCCDIYIKISSFDEAIGIYCPICGGTGL